jgi:hypothetical protein
MNWFRKHTIAVGGTAVAISLLTFTAPHAAHALAVALVQVTNTAATPAITQDVSRLASQNVQLLCPEVLLDCSQILPDGSSGGSYVVPGGHSLVITTVQINTSLTIQNSRQLTQAGGRVRGSWTLSTPGSFQFQYPSGIVFSSGSGLVMVGAGADTDQAYLTGYIVSN